VEAYRKKLAAAPPVPGRRGRETDAEHGFCAINSALEQERTDGV
jgi:hypothetical protein